MSHVDTTGGNAAESSREILPNRLYTTTEVARLLRMRTIAVRQIKLRWVKHAGLETKENVTLGEELLRYVRESLAFAGAD